MTTRHRIGLCLALVLLTSALSSCSTVGPRLKDADVRVENGVLHWQGDLTTAAVKRAGSLMDDADPPVRLISIESGGGDVAAGIALGTWMLANKIDVEVVGRGCVSSCANYIFIAGRNRRIAPGAVVAWHGSAIQLDWGGRENADRRSMLRQLREAQRKFFALTTVDERVTVVGQDLACQCTWILSVADMARFGIDRVDAPVDYATTLPAWSTKDSGLKVLALPDDVFKRIRASRLEPPPR